MVRPRFVYLLAGVLMILCWFSTTTPAVAHPFSANPPSTVAIATSSSGGSPLFSFSGKRPTNLGVKEGKLAVCPSSPNCVNSQLAESDQEHAIAPLTYQSEPTKAMATLKSVIEAMPRTKIISETDNYLYAEFTSALMGFVDDVEFYLSPNESVIHVRSASRLGQSDLGVNRNRIEAIRSQFLVSEEKA